MSTGLSINKATYGAGGSSVDVTSTVSAKVKDGVLNFTVSPTSLGIEDPAPGQIKTLEVDYTINDGKKNTISKRDNDLVSIDAPPVRLASGLQIIKAEYGYSGNWTDVTNAVQDLMGTDGSINITIGFKQLGLPDPNPNKQKQLKVEYTINGASTSDILNDGQKFKVSAPAKEDVTGAPKIQEGLGSFIWLLVKGAFQTLAIFLQVSSGFITAKYGEFLFGPSDVFWWIFMMLGLFIPLFGFLGLPFFAFWIRLFRSDNVLPA